MNARQRMIHRARIERDQAWGQEISPGHRADAQWEMHLVNVPCLFWAEAGQGQSSMPHRLAVVSTYRLILPRGTDVLERDRITLIDDRNRKPIFTGLLAIQQIIHRSSHSLLLLEQVA